MKTINKPVEVMSLTDEEGVITPYRVKVETKDGPKEEYKVLRILKSDLSRIAGYNTLIFDCELEIDGKSRPCELRMHKERCTWTIHRI